MDIKTFKSVAGKLPPHIARLLRGPTGIGKSFVVKQLAEEKSKVFVDVRGSTMSEGDVVGYPDLEGMKKTGVATMCVPGWFARACNEPCVLMLDELNRSLPAVMQAFFQICLDRELGNDADGIPHRLHPETEIYAAVNVGNEYDVTDMDPALLRRFWVCDLEPSHAGWIEWVKANDIDDLLIEFIRQEPAHWRVDPAGAESGAVLPTPASWHRLDEALTFCGWNPSKFAGQQTPEGFYAMALGMVGAEAAIAFVNFVKEYEKVITAEDVLEGRVTGEEVKEQQAGTINNVIDKLAEHCKENSWTAKQANRVAQFGIDLGGELMVQLWNRMSGSNNLPNIQKLHKKMGAQVVAAVQASRNLS